MYVSLVQFVQDTCGVKNQRSKHRRESTLENPATTCSIVIMLILGWIF